MSEGLSKIKSVRMEQVKIDSIDPMGRPADLRCTGELLD